MLNVLSLFSGIGAFEKALKNLNIPYNLLAYCEIDKYASKAYSLIHDVPETMNLHDVTKVDMLDIEDRVDLITYGFPCQDISNAGYNNYWQVLNAKDYGIPQNRERVFIISIRKDIDKGFTFPEHIPLELRLKDILEETVDEKFYLSDKMLEKITYEDKTSQTGIIQKADLHKGGQKSGVLSTEGICTSLTATDYKQPKQIIDSVKVSEATKQGYAEASIGDSVNLEHPNSKTRRGRVGKEVAQTLTTSCNQAVVVPDVVRLGGLYDTEKSTRQAGSVYDKNGVSPTLSTMQGGYRQPMIIEDKDYIDEFLNEV